jgi:error-prone DNA polymerase
LQREGIVIHLIAHKMEDMTESLRALAAPGVDEIEPPHARADAVKHPNYEDRRIYPSRDFH